MRRTLALAVAEDRRRYALLIAAVAATAMLSAGHAQASPLTEGSILPNYAVVSVGPNASVMVNSGPINGAVLLGDGANATSSGGGGGSVTGGVWDSGTVTGDNLQNLNTPPTVHTLAATVATTAFSNAATLSAAAASLTANMTYASTVMGPVVINGTPGGTEVVDFNNGLQNPNITINGNSSETFVFNVSGLFNTNQAITLNGVTASQILWNFTGTSGTVFQTSGGDVLYGTFLATDGGSFQFSALDLDGQLINTDGHMQIVSNSTIPTAAPFSPPTPVPEPMTLSLFGAGLAGALWIRRRRKA